MGYLLICPCLCREQCYNLNVHSGPCYKEEKNFTELQAIYNEEILNV